MKHFNQFNPGQLKEKSVILTSPNVRSEVRTQMESMSSRVDRVEGELEYLENKIPAPQNIEIEEALLEQQVMDAELEQLKKKAKLKLNNGI